MRDAAHQHGQRADGGAPQAHRALLPHKQQHRKAQQGKRQHIYAPADQRPHALMQRVQDEAVDRQKAKQP